MGSAAGEVVAIRITEEGQVWMRNDRGLMVQVSLTDKEVEQLQRCTLDSRVSVLAAIIARIARPH